MLPTVTSILARDVTHARAWVEANKQSIASDPFWWRSLAEGAAVNARYMYNGSSLEWGALAVTIYEVLESTMPASAGFWKLCAIIVRAQLIAAHGHQPNHPVLDVDVIVRWFREHEPFTLEEVESKIEAGLALHGTRLPEDVPRFGRLQTQFNILQSLVASGALQPDESLSRWLALRDKLP